MRIRSKPRLLLGLLALGAALSTAGCGRFLAFGTNTTFGLDISQRPDATVDLAMGYRRYEMASIPVDGEDAGKDTDAYGVVGTFDVKYGNPLIGETEPFVLNQMFATGYAAQRVVHQEGFAEYFGRQTGRIVAENEEVNKWGGISEEAAKRYREQREKEREERRRRREEAANANTNSNTNTSGNGAAGGGNTR